MPVPLLDVNAQNLPLEAGLTEAFTRVLRSGQFIMGPDVTAFEAEVAKFAGAKNAIGVSSGTDAILLALMALGIGPGDEVLCPTFTFFATAGCVARAGATPVFVDADPLTFNLDVADAARKVTSKTKAIIPVHLFGQSAEMDAVMDLARKHNLAVIEDGAQSLGAKYAGRQVGSIGTFGTYSFFPSKNLGALGDAGMVVSSDDALAEKARLLRTHGSKPKYYHKLVGANFRLDSIQAAFLRVKLPHYGEYTTRRKANAGFYTEKLSKLPGVALASEGDSNAKMILPVAQPKCDHIWNQYTLRLPGAGRRDAFKKHLTDRGIGTEIYYPVPMHEQECFAQFVQEGNAKVSCPIASRLAQEVISIPIYPELQSNQLAEVVEAISAFLKL
ncbi:MAG TPA: DegT/DnrJ/EryC1/StrS family aminotransferase [Verrucomicrobiae bacterium]